MGRKIPGKRHHGVKDPEKQQATRLKLLKDKINRAPTNPDEQPIPKSLQKIINLKNQCNSVQIRNSKSEKQDLKRSEDVNPSKKRKPIKRLGKPDKVPVNFSQLPGESDRAFMGRVNLTVKEFLKETQFENKFGVDIMRDKITGEVTGLEKRPKDELDELLKKSNLKRGKKKKKKKNESDEPRLTKTQKRSKKLTEKKQRKELARIDEFDKFTDTVKFGEIVHAPPTLSKPKRVPKSNQAPRPGQKDLLLKHTASISNSSSIPGSLQKASVKDVVKVDRKGKRKELPPAVRLQLETVQSEVMKAYRCLKSHQ